MSMVSMFVLDAGLFCVCFQISKGFALLRRFPIYNPNPVTSASEGQDRLGKLGVAVVPSLG